MKITRRQLRQLITEEAGRLNEVETNEGTQQEVLSTLKAILEIVQRMSVSGPYYKGP
jgi:hypothetical protein